MLPEAVGANLLLLPMALKEKLLEAPHALNGFAVMNVLGPDRRALDLDLGPPPLPQLFRAQSMQDSWRLWLEQNREISPCPVYCSFKCPFF